VLIADIQNRETMLSYWIFGIAIFVLVIAIVLKVHGESLLVLSIATLIAAVFTVIVGIMICYDWRQEGELNMRMVLCLFLPSLLLTAATVRRIVRGGHRSPP
jgi:hypothetical protein